MGTAPLIELTSAQHDALSATHVQPVRVVDPRNNAAYVLLPAAQYDTVREILDDEREQLAVRKVGLKNALGRAAAE